MFEQMVIAAMVIMGGLFALAIFGTSWLLSPTKPEHGKGITYECGVDPIGGPWIRFRSSFYVFAILYVIFDIEVVFLYPWALTLGAAGMAWFIFIEMLIFVAILLAGLAYAWKEGALEWH